MAERLKVTLGFVLAIALALAALGQYLLGREGTFREGVLLLLFGLVVLMFLEWQVRDSRAQPAVEMLPVPGEESEPQARWLIRQHGLRIVLNGLVVVSAVLALSALNRDPRQPEAAFVWWGLSFILLVAAWIEPARIRGWRFEWRRPEVAVVVLLVVLAAVLRLFSLATIPQNLGGDEGSQGLAAIDFITGKQRDMFNVGWYGVPTMSFFFQSFSFRLAGVSTFTLRLPWAIIGTLTILLYYWVLRPLFGTRIALIATLVLATYHYHIHYSRLGSNQVADPFFLLLVLGLLLHGLRTGNRLSFLLSGAVVGLSLYFYAGARLTPILLASVIGIWIVFRRGFWREHRANLLLAVFAFLIVGAPMLLFAVKQPNDFNARFNQVNIFASGWIEAEMKNSGRSMWAILADQTQRAVFSFNYYADRTVWYGARVPFLTFVGAILFVLGMGYAIAQGSDPRFLPFVLWFWLGVILGGALNESPPSSMRLITLAPSLCLFPVIGLTKLADLARALWARWRVTVGMVEALVIAWLCLASVWFYFREYTPMRIYGSTNAEVATVAGYYLHELGPQHKLYFFGLPRMYWGFASLPFLAPGTEGQDIVEPIRGTPTFVDRSRPAVFIFLPERQGDLQAIVDTFPGGRLREFRQEAVPQTLFWAYELDRPAGSS